MHLGINISNGYANCWRCGWHSLKKVIAALLNIPESQARTVLKEYGGTSVKKVPETVAKIRVKQHKLPTDTGPLRVRHRRYLERRGFDPQTLQRAWKLQGTGPMSTLDKTSYKHRIVAPIFWDGEQVSFQARDITGKQKAKYMACPQDRELVQHQTILYGIQSEWEDTGIAVEGITDVWRLGPKAFGTFGIDFTQKQVRAMSAHFRRVVIIFDDEPQAQSQARKLQKELAVRGVEGVIETIEGDPGALDEGQAKALIRKIF